MTSTPSATPRVQSFDRRVDDVKPSKSDINFVIMDYLINEGYPSAARRFADEANIPPSHCPGDMDSIQERVEIKEAILEGRIQSALESINEINPELLDTNPALHFALLRLQLIELIRNSSDDLTAALEFAQRQLAPRAPAHPTFLRDLEQTMALLIFPPNNLSKELSDLLEPNLKQTVAASVNEAILESQGYRKSARLRSLVKLRAWAEKQARADDTVKVGLPEKMSIWGSDGNGDTIMGGPSAVGEGNGHRRAESFTTASS